MCHEFIKIFFIEMDLDTKICTSCHWFIDPMMFTQAVSIFDISLSRLHFTAIRLLELSNLPFAPSLENRSDRFSEIRERIVRFLIRLGITIRFTKRISLSQMCRCHVLHPVSFFLSFLPRIVQISLQTKSQLF